MEHHGSAGTAMLGLSRFVLLGVSTAFGELEQVIQTTETSVWRHGCGVAAKPHGRRRTLVRDLASAGRPGDVAVAQAAVALPRAGVRGADVERDKRAHPRP